MSAIISRSKRFIALRNPKTGGTSLTQILVQSGCVADQDADPETLDRITVPPSMLANDPMLYHSSLAELVRIGDVTREEADTFPVYCFYRDPVERFMSALGQVKLNMPDCVFPYFGLLDAEAMADVSYEHVVDLLPRLDLCWFKPQAHWLSDPRVIALPYEEYADQVGGIVAKHGGTLPPDLGHHPRYTLLDNRMRRAAWPAMDDALTAQVREFYAGDYQFDPKMRAAA